MVVEVNRCEHAYESAMSDVAIVPRAAVDKSCERKSISNCPFSGGCVRTGRYVPGMQFDLLPPATGRDTPPNNLGD